MKHLVCFGFGYSAGALAPRLKSKGWQVTGTSQSAETAGRITAGGIEAAVFDGAAPSYGVNKALETATHLVVSIPPGDTGDVTLAHHGSAISAAPKLEWIAYLSTVGVYGDHGGAWVDETTPPAPASLRSKRRLDAERAWLDLAGGSQGKEGRQPRPKVQVFRLAGIYGPGRSAIDQILAGRARRIIKPGQVFNRIHVEDIAGVLEAAIEHGGSHSVYNVADDAPAPPQDVIAYAAELLGRPAPPEIAFEDADLSPMGRSFYSEAKRVRNERIKTDLKFALRFPTYKEGLAAIAERLS